MGVFTVMYIYFYFYYRYAGMPSDFHLSSLLVHLAAYCLDACILLIVW